MQRRPQPTEHAPYFSRYIDLVPESDILAALESQMDATAAVLKSVGEERSGYRYADGKWTIKQVIGHVSDAERIFAYRALAIARGEKNPLPGFDEDTYVRQGEFDAWRYTDLVDALLIVRRSNVLMLRNLTPDAWDRRGVANDSPATVRALAYSMLGHERHHLNVLRERYGIGGTGMLSAGC